MTCVFLKFISDIDLRISLIYIYPVTSFPALHQTCVMCMLSAGTRYCLMTLFSNRRYPCLSASLSDQLLFRIRPMTSFPISQNLLSFYCLTFHWEKKGLSSAIQLASIRLVTKLFSQIYFKFKFVQQQNNFVFSTIYLASNVLFNTKTNMFGPSLASFETV